MEPQAAQVFVIDDEEVVRDSIAMLMRSVGVSTKLFPDAISFLAVFKAELVGCLVLDVRMPRMSGLELQQELKRRGSTLPVIFMTGHGDVPMAVEAMRAGAVDFLQKPFKDDELIRRVQKALDQHGHECAHQRAQADIKQRFEALTPRERQVAWLIVAGHANKVIAIDLELSERTVELHRAHVMQKMEAKNLPQLVQMLMQLQEEQPGSQTAAAVGG